MLNSMFDGLKEVKSFKKITRFQEWYNIEYVKEIKRLSLQKAESCLELKQASLMELFVA